MADGGEKVIGILGGMGPEATVELFARIVKETPASKDQDHLRIIVDNNPKIPDRTNAILGRGPSPLPEMIKTAKNLERAGADFIVMPCNTAHYYYDELSRSVNIPILNMVELAVRELKIKYPNAKRVGIIATDGTIKGKVYDRYLSGAGVETIYPEGDLQRKAMDAIYKHIKAGDLTKGREAAIEVAKHLIELGSDVIILGCTEVSLVLKDGDLPKPIIDPLSTLARTAVAIALGKGPADEARGKVSGTGR